MKLTAGPGPGSGATLDGVRDIKVYQNRDGYRFSVDALLLYSFVNAKYATRIVDLGAGSGIIGLLLARKYPGAAVSLVELQDSLQILAEKNVRLNGLQERVEVVKADIKGIGGVMSGMSCDVAVSNPPFRREASGRLCLEEEKAVARHEIRLCLGDLAAASSYLLKAKGRFFIVYHPERLLELIQTLRSNGLEPKRIRFVHNDCMSRSKIVLLEAAKGGRQGLKIDRPLFMYDSSGEYTQELREMYGD